MASQVALPPLRALKLFWENHPQAKIPLLIGAYERAHWAIEPPDTVSAIREVMALRSYTQSDLARLLGSRSRASEILSGRRGLTMEQARALHRQWQVPAESLLAG